MTHITVLQRLGTKVWRVVAIRTSRLPIIDRRLQLKIISIFYYYLPRNYYQFEATTNQFIDNA